VAQAPTFLKILFLVTVVIILYMNSGLKYNDFPYCLTFFLYNVMYF